MRRQVSELSLGKHQTRRKSSKFLPLIALTVLLTIPLYYPFIRDSSRKLYEASRSYESLEESIRSKLYIHSPIIKSTKPPIDIPKTDSNDAFTNYHDDVKHLVDQRENTLPDHGGVAEQQHDEVVHEKKHVKGRRKRSARAQPNIAKDSRAEHVRARRKEHHAPTRNRERTMIRSEVLDYDKCDLFTGEWVPNPEGPYYTNVTCNAIQEHQNCLKFGRPDRGFLKWRWKPDDCELSVFDPASFLELMRGKSIAFVGDSVARNHMQSLICLLSRVVIPVDLSDPLDQNRRYEYRDHDFNVSMFWAPYLVKTLKTDPNDEKRPFNLYLDEFDLHWTTKIVSYDYVIISAGHWFFRPMYFYQRNRLVGCQYCPESNVNHLSSYFGYRRAFRTAFRAINAAANFNGVTFLRSFAPSHFEGAPWDKGGDCPRTRPFKRNETVLEDYSLQMYLIQLDELRIAQRARRRNRGKLRLFDATKLMQMRPDGHPSKYGHWQVPNQAWANDCVHWCLPGPIDSWNDFLQELLRREIENVSRQSN